MACVNRVLVVGGGLAGLTCALALRRKGVNCDVVEIAGGSVGAAITIMGRAVEALDELRVLGACQSEGVIDPLDRGAGLFDVHGATLDPRPHKSVGRNVGLYRPVLSRILAEEAEQRGATVRTGLGLAALTQGEQRVEASFTDGSRGVYDLVVAADGIRSTVRSLVFGDAVCPAFTGQRYIRWMTPGAPITAGPSLLYVAPFGKVLGYALPRQNLIYAISVFASERADHVDGDAARAMLDAQLSLFTAPYIVELRRRLTADVPLLCRAFESLLMPDPWYRGRVVLIGDAAHATTAHLASGGGMAIEDSMVLADCLEGAGSVAEALQGFMRRRFERVRIVVETSAELSRMESQGADAKALEARRAPATAALAEAY